MTVVRNVNTSLTPACLAILSALLATCLVVPGALPLLGPGAKAPRPIPQNLTLIGQGDGTNQRSGRKIKSVSLRIRGHIV